MKCPRDPDVTLLMSSREGIEIDYCPECRGVWLDRGELDKLIERSTREEDERRDGRDDDRRRYEERSSYQDKDRGSSDRGYSDRDYKKKKRKGFLSDLFEFGD